MQNQIEQDRQAALDLLKPSRKELEHGLELHANSLVVESYGFAPRSVIRAEVMNPAIEGGASADAILELQDKEAMTRWAVDEEEKGDFLLAWGAAGVTGILQNAGAATEDVPGLVRRVAHFTYSCELGKAFCFRAYAPDEIPAAREEGRRCLYLGSNTTPLALLLRDVDEEVAYIRTLFRLGVRMMHLTYQRANLLGSGCGEARDAGLTDLGRRAVAEMNRVGVIVDVSHSGQMTSLEAAQASDQPVVASHATCHAISGHYRGKTDEVIRAISESDGYLGVCWVPRFLGGSGDLNAVLDHIDHIALRFGVERVAVGPDVICYNRERQEAEWARTVKRSPRPTHWRSLWPPPGVADPEGHTDRQKRSLSWTNWPLLTVGLVLRGYGDEDIRKIIGGNVMRVARAVWLGRDEK